MHLPRVDQEAGRDPGIQSGQEKDPRSSQESLGFSHLRIERVLSETQRTAYREMLGPP